MNIVVACNKSLRKNMKEYLPSKKYNINILDIIVSIKGADEFIEKVEICNPHTLFWVHGIPCKNELEVLLKLKERIPEIRIIYNVTDKVEIDDYENFITALIQHGIYDIILGTRTVDSYHKHILTPIETFEKAFSAAKIAVPQDFVNDETEKAEQENLAREFESIDEVIAFDGEDLTEDNAVTAMAQIKDAESPKVIDEAAQNRQFEEKYLNIGDDDDISDLIRNMGNFNGLEEDSESVENLAAKDVPFGEHEEEYFASKEENDTSEEQAEDDVAVVSSDNKPVENEVTEPEGSVQNRTELYEENIEELISNSNSEEYFASKEGSGTSEERAEDNDSQEIFSDDNDVNIASFDNSPDNTITENDDFEEIIHSDNEFPFNEDELSGENVEELISKSNSEEYFAGKEESDTSEEQAEDDVVVVTFDNKPVENEVTKPEGPIQNRTELYEENIEELISNSNSEEYFASKEGSDTSEEQAEDDVAVVTFDNKPYDFEELLVPKASGHITDILAVAPHITVGVNQLIHRSGCTHISVELAMYLKKQYTVGMVFSSDETYLNFADYLNVECRLDDGFKYNGVSFYAPNCINISQGSNQITVADFGIVDENTLNEYEKSPYKLMIADFEFWNVSTIEKYIVECNKSYVPQTHFLFNLIGENRFNEKIKPLERKGFKVYRLSASESCLDYSENNAAVFGKIFNICNDERPSRNGLFKKRKNKIL